MIDEFQAQLKWRLARQADSCRVCGLQSRDVESSYLYPMPTCTDCRVALLELSAKRRRERAGLS